MTQNSPKDWRELCRKAQEELDPDKLMDLIVEINKALDEQARRRKGGLDKINDLDPETEAQPFDAILPKRWRRNPVVQLQSLTFVAAPKSA